MIALKSSFWVHYATSAPDHPEAFEAYIVGGLKNKHLGQAIKMCFLQALEVERLYSEKSPERSLYASVQLGVTRLWPEVLRREASNSHAAGLCSFSTSVVIDLASFPKA